MKKSYPLFFLIFLTFNVFGQFTEITSGSTKPNITANSVNNGIILPRMSTLQKEAISSLTEGMIVYDTDLQCVSVFNGALWTCVSAAPNGPIFQSLQTTLNPSGNCPLCGQIAVKSNQAIKVSYKVKGQDGEDFSFSLDKFSKDTTINLFGLYANYNNQVTVKIKNQTGDSLMRDIYVQTAALPVDLPQSNEIVVNAHNADILTKFIMCFPFKTQGAFNKSGGVTGYPTIIDSYGKIRWYLNIPLESNTIMVPLKNQNWLLTFATLFKEIDLMGNVKRDINIPKKYPYHHDVIQLPNENLMYLGDSKLNNTIEDKIYSLDFSTGVVSDSINLYTLLDPSRPQLPVGAANDWFHANSIFYDSIDNAVLVSGRQQSAVVKIDLLTKELKWILSDPTGWNSNLRPKLLTPSGENFEQQWGQHSAILKPNDNHTILLFDNGNNRSYTNPVLPINNYSRIVEYTIDETNKTVVQNFQFGKEQGSSTFAPYVGKVEYITDNRFFIDYGGITKDINNNAVELSPNARNQVRLYEVDRNQNVYFDISIKNPVTTDPQLIGFRSYRAFPFKFK